VKAAPPERVQEAVMRFQGAIGILHTQGSASLILEATREIRSLLCMDEPPIDSLVAAGLIPQLVQLLWSVVLLRFNLPILSINVGLTNGDHYPFSGSSPTVDEGLKLEVSLWNEVSSH